ncbi:MAG: hypothetical protein QXP36_02085 [Conexivisphaerales archaeon]
MDKKSLWLTNQIINNIVYNKNNKSSLRFMYVGSNLPTDKYTDEEIQSCIRNVFAEAQTVIEKSKNQDISIEELKQKLFEKFKSDE